MCCVFVCLHNRLTMYAFMPSNRKCQSMYADVSFLCCLYFAPRWCGFVLPVELSRIHSARAAKSHAVLPGVFYHKALWHLQPNLACHARQVLPLALLCIDANVVRDEQVLRKQGGNMCCACTPICSSQEHKMCTL